MSLLFRHQSLLILRGNTTLTICCSWLPWSQGFATAESGVCWLAVCVVGVLAACVQAADGLGLVDLGVVDVCIEYYILTLFR